jgi:hypothetical protein
VFTLIFGGAFVVAWLVCGFTPWLVLSVATRGQAGLGQLPLCLFAGVVAGLAVPILGMTNRDGIWLSFVAAAGVPLLLLAARRLSAGAHRTSSPAGVAGPSSRLE